MILNQAIIIKKIKRKINNNPNHLNNKKKYNYLNNSIIIKK